MEKLKPQHKSTFFIALTIITIISFITFIYTTYKSTTEKTDKIAWLLQHKDYSPKIELNMQAIEKCSRTFTETHFDHVYAEDNALLQCYNNINKLLLNIAPYSNKWSIITTGINNLYEKIGITPEQLINLNHAAIYKSSFEFAINPELKKKLIKNIPTVNALIILLMDQYNKEYAPRGMIPTPTEEYYFQGNFMESYVACLSPEKLGFATSDECSMKILKYDYASPPEIANKLK